MLLLCALNANASHNRAGEITYVHAPVDGQDFRYEFTFITYTNTFGTDVDADSLEVSWGDGNSETVARINGNDSDGNGIPNGENIGNNTKKNLYQTVHVFPGFAPFYAVSMSDPNRNGGVLNMSDSFNEIFYLEDTLFLLNPQFYGFNSSPILVAPPIDFAQVEQPFIHNPTAFDPDGDSLVFELVVPKGVGGAPVLGYQFPNEIIPGANNNISLNSETGEFVWESPQKVGEYNIAFLITEYRAGLKIGTMIRDMQIFVRQFDNTPPEIVDISDTCVWIGDTIERAFFATDDDTPAQIIDLIAYGLPFELDDGSLSFEVSIGSNEASADFAWATNCSHIFSDDYTIVVKAEDNFEFAGGPVPLTDVETWRLSLVPPPPTGLVAITEIGQIILNWEDTYICGDSDKFIGFSIWRSVGCDSLSFDKCQQGLSGTTYTKIANRVEAYNYVDESAVKGLEYSYRVVAEFSDANSDQGFPINIAESHPSGNACAYLPSDLPIITHVSVEETNATNGVIEVRWTKPDPMVLDTIINVPPYSYEVYRADGKDGTNYNKVADFSYGSFSLANDTVYLDQGINTLEQDYNYKVRFLASGDDDLGETETASSVFINAIASNEQLLLSWNEEVPWVNQSYIVYRADEFDGPYDSLAVITDNFYQDDGLVNGTEYCYYVTSIGTYFSPNLPDSLLNDSQILCAIPVDTIPPCPPVLSVVNACEDISIGEDFAANYLTWDTPFLVCGDADVAFYNIYYRSSNGASFELVGTSENGTIDYRHEIGITLAGCYYITAVDHFNNESQASNTVCKESCLEYDLPNTFTPGSDGQNDFFTPLRDYRFVSRVEFKVFNRWGNLVFETEDIELNWGGQDFKNDQDLPEAVYYYTCNVYEQSFDGSELLQKEMSGYIHLFRDVE